MGKDTESKIISMQDWKEQHRKEKSQLCPDELVDKLSEIFPQIAENRVLRDQVRGYFEPSKPAQVSKEDLPPDRPGTVQDYQDLLFKLFKYSAIIRLEGQVVSGRKISGKRASELANLIVDSTKAEIEFLTEPDFKEFLQRTKLPFEFLS